MIIMPISAFSMSAISPHDCFANSDFYLVRTYPIMILEIICLKIGLGEFIKPNFRCARRRHWCQGLSSASGVLTSKRDACALTAGDGEGLGPAVSGAFSKR